MALSIEQLLTPIDEDEALEQVLDIFQSLGFQARSWQSGSIPRTILEYCAKFTADQSVITVAIAEYGFNQFATGDGLTLFSSSHYENDRVAAVRARGNVTLTVASGSGPYSQGIGTVIVMDSSRGLRYSNVNALTLTDSAPTTDLFEAEIAGADGSDPGLNEVDTLVTSLAGVTTTNASDWITVAGADEESDDELRTRNRNKWTGLGASGPKGIYVTLALEGDPSVTRVGVDDTNALGTGTVGVYLADDDTDNNGITGAAITAVQTNTDNGIPLTSTATVAAAADLDITVTYAATHDATVFATPAAAVAAIDAALVDLWKSTAVGGITDGVTRVFPLGTIYSAMIAVPGIVNSTLTAPTADTPILISEVAMLIIDPASSSVPVVT